MKPSVLFLAVFLFFITVLPCFSGGPYILEKGFHYMWSDADVYNEPDFSSDIIGKVHFNTRVEILTYIEIYAHDNNNDYDYWYKVKVNESIGYIFGRYFSSERIAHIDQNGIEYVLLLYYSSSNSMYSIISDKTIKIIIDGNEINFVSPAIGVGVGDGNIYLDSSSGNGNYAYTNWYIQENFLVLIYDEETIYENQNEKHIFRYVFNGHDLEKVYVNWYWGDKGGDYTDVILLKWDTEKQIYYEIEETIEEQFVEEKEERKDSDEIIKINRDAVNYPEIEESGYFNETKRSKNYILDDIVNKIISNKIIIGSTLFLLGIFIFVFINYKQKKRK